MAGARHGMARSRWSGAAIAVIVVVVLGGAAFAAVRLSGGKGATAPPGRTSSVPTTAPTTRPGPTTRPSSSAGPTTGATTGPSATPPSSTEPSPEPTTGPSPEPTTTTGPSPEPSSSPTSPSPGPSTTPPAFDTLRPGMTGPKVKRLQQSLEAIGYWLGTDDGSYGDATTQAVMAFQGYEGLARDGIAGPQTQAKLQTAERPVPRDPSTDEMEIDKPHQVILVVRDGRTKYVFHTSTGFDGAYVDPDGHDQVADTPEGHFTFIWQVDGWRDGDLGMLYRPKYFHPTGVAIHGYGNVPGYPASHGCARMSFEAINFIWDQDLAPLQSKVWVY
jgi:Putative peptidoglycan binding domain/L,D-transpeptidase catalytic domain